ncbi:HAD-IIIC family phosphatase [Hyphomicrobium sp. LHD-15]|uniref:HAD-IIIC family phosphatase n=1 Tax=Hyphomicrobium sp. LHD-15 TaxID=3072142 RepID=UPI00280DC6E6|nr:HAD-IIIC family phosphatase [Hyphomicrobium sp. LHD-15]MDQ8698269.1 HAD-IIIC family phosphatase [Hyphomicrobium sp. LHD-15]
MSSASSYWQSGAGAGRPGLALATEDKIGEIVDAVIAAAPECLRQRVILPAIDWSKVPPPKVSLLLLSLAEAGLSVPRWLSKALLLAGHKLDAGSAQTLTASLAVLNRLNAASGEWNEREAVSGAIATLAYDPDIDPAVVGALLRRLMALSWDEEALRLALAHYHRMPHILNQIGDLLETHVAQLPAARLHVSGSSTTWTLIEAIRPAFAVEGVRAEIAEGLYGSALSDLITPPTDVDALVVLLDFESLLPRDWRLGSHDLENRLVAEAEVLANALEAFSTRTHVPLLINTLPVPSAPTAGFLDRSHATGLRRAVDILNARIFDAAERSSRIVVIDADQALSSISVQEQADPKLWYYGRIAYSADATRLMARAFAEAWQLQGRGRAKVLAVDFDNTLWGGVYSDDGPERLACSHDFPGNAYQALQKECLRLKGQGLLLVALSKNNADAISVFEQHPGMVLRADDFSATAINWQPKPENIRKLAADLNLGLDTFLFIDDSPHEREAMRRLCPEVMVPEMPSDPAERPIWLRRLAATWPVRITAEDETRATLYAVEREARKAKVGAASIDQFLAGLEQNLVLSFVSSKTAARAAQMHQRTNQFNLTTLRLTESDIARYMNDEASGIAVQGRVIDKFGDHGLVVAATVDIDAGEAIIRTLVMSCRVIGREIERAFVGELLRALARRGIRRVRGEFVPTPKNAMVRDFYASCGFTQTSTDAGRTTWLFVRDASDEPASTFVTASWEI